MSWTREMEVAPGGGHTDSEYLDRPEHTRVARVTARRRDLTRLSDAYRESNGCARAVLNAWEPNRPELRA